MKLLEEALERVEAFYADLKAQGIHVGVGKDPVCATCDVPWPCAASQAGPS